MDHEVIETLKRLEQKIDHLTQLIETSINLYRRIQIQNEEQLRSFYDKLRALERPPQ